VLVGKKFRASPGVPASQQQEIMSDADLAGAERWLRDRLILVNHDSEDSAPDLGWLIDRFRLAVVRHGVTDVMIDPWTEIDATTGGGDNSAENLRRNLQRLTSFGRRHNVNIWVIAHPTKLVPAKPGAKIPVPSIYDIAGGAQWANKARMVLAIYRDDQITEVHTQKIARQPLWGRQHAIAKLRFNRGTGRFTSADAEPPASQPGFADI
jgi:twinkle protein